MFWTQCQWFCRFLSWERVGTFCVSQALHYFAGAAITNYLKLGGFKRWMLFSHRLGASGPISRCWQGGSPELPGTVSRLLDGGDSGDKPWCALVVADHPSLCPCSHGRLPVSLLSASYKDICQWVQGPPHSMQPHRLLHYLQRPYSK